MKKRTIQCLGLILLCLPLYVFAKQKILIIESYHSEYPWDQSYIQGIKYIFKDKYDLVYFQMDTKRLPKSAFQERADKAWENFQELKPDLVILGDDNALDYLGARLSKTATPVIYLGINNNPRNYHIRHSKNITGILERPLIKRSIPIITQLFPHKISNILLMLDNSLTANTILNEIFANNTQLIISGIKVEIDLIHSWETWQEKLLAAGKYDAVFLGLFHTLIDKHNNHIPAEQVIKWSSQNTPVPPFGFWDFAIGKDKAIGGLVHFGFEQGKTAAEMAKKILSANLQPYQIGTVTAEKGGYLFSRTELQKYNLKLPEKIADKTIFID